MEISKSLKIWLISALLILYGVYNALTAIGNDQYGYLFWSFCCFVGGFGLLLRKSWSQYIVYFVCLFVVSGWVYITLNMALNDWPYSKLSQTIISLIPGLLLVLVCTLSSVFIYTYFKKRQR